MKKIPVNKKIFSLDELTILRSSVAHVSDSVLITDALGLSSPGPIILYVNDAFVKMTGYSSEEVIGNTPRILQGPNTDRVSLDRLKDNMAAMQPTRMELLNYKKNGEEYWSEVDVFPFANNEGVFTHWVSIQRDITEKRLAEEAIWKSELRYHTLVNQLSEGVLLVSSDYLIVTANLSACKMLGVNTEDDLIGKNIFNLDFRWIDKSYNSVKVTDHALARTFILGVVNECISYGLMDKNNDLRWVTTNSILLNNDFDSGKPVAMVCLNDITAQYEFDNKFALLSQQDALTGLPNRSFFLDCFLPSSMKVTPDDVFGVFVLDLDNFKEINDSLGHHFGDQMLRVVGNRLRNLLRSDDIVARLGGDEFGIITHACKSVDEIQVIADKINSVLSEVSEIDDHKIITSASVGVAIYPKDGQDIESLMRQADLAMYEAKKDGRSRTNFFAEVMQSNAITQIDMKNRLRRALEDGQFELHYQPRVMIATGKVCGAEALIRWRGDDGKLISPLDFIPLAEETGLIEPIGRWVLETAVNDLAIFDLAGYKDAVVSINLSPLQFQSDRLIEDLYAASLRRPDAASRIELEITESAIMKESDRALKILAAIEKIGFSVAIDDFGTGYSSLSYLQRFHVATLKIDRVFVSGLSESKENVAITKAIISLSNTLLLRTVAEGVETPEQLELLGLMGCDEYQGFFFSKPRPLHDLMSFLKSRETD
jgi:diguanylate cyclase (GGDEF)-like protein/PAS domain S-box-containing protein